MTPQLILASSSPRRRDLLTLVGIPHTVQPADIDETAIPGEEPAPHVERLAREKARVVVALHAAHGRSPVVVAADTTVAIDGRILGKPRDIADAEATLRLLAGRAHTVYTAMAVGRGSTVVSAVNTVGVTFRHLTDDEIAAYVRTGEPMDKAGSYGIQGYGATIVRRIEGDYFAVMGLGLVTLVDLLRAVDVRYEFGAGISSGA